MHAQFGHQFDVYFPSLLFVSIFSVLFSFSFFWAVCRPLNDAHVARNIIKCHYHANVVSQVCSHWQPFDIGISFFSQYFFLSRLLAREFGCSSVFICAHRNSYNNNHARKTRTKWIFKTFPLCLKIHHRSVIIGVSIFSRGQSTHTIFVYQATTK